MIGALVEFKSDFKEGTFQEKDLGHSSTAARIKIIGCGIVKYILSDNYSRKAVLRILANYSKNVLHRQVSPQWMKKYKKIQDVPKEF